MPSRLPVLALALFTAAPAFAQTPWGDPGFQMGPYPYGWADAPSRGDPREGRVTADRFLAPDAGALLLQAHAAVQEAPGGSGDERESATFAAAVTDQLAKAGYDTANPDPQGGLVTDVREVRDVVVPEEPPHSPVSGEADVGVSNYGSMVGLAVNVDLSKPAKALIATRLEVTVRDRASGKALWEGRAAIVTREGDAHWSDTAIAGRLAGALFTRFPGPATVHR